MLRGKAEKEKGDEAWEGDKKGLERVKVEAKKRRERNEREIRKNGGEEGEGRGKEGKDREPRSE